MRLKLALAVAILALWIVGTIGLVAERYAADVLRRAAHTRIGDIADQVTGQLDRGMFERYREIRNLAALDPFRRVRGSRVEQRALLDRLQQTYPDYAWVGVADPGGRVLASTGRLLEGVDVSRRPWFEKGRQGPFVGDVHEAKLLATRLPPPADDDVIRFVDVAVPIGAPGEPPGVLGAHLSLAWAREIEASLLGESERAQGIEIFVLDDRSAVILGPRGSVGTTLALPAGDRRPGKGLSGEWPDGVRYVAAESRSSGYRDYPGLGWRVVLRQPEKRALASLAELRRHVALAGGGIAVVALLLGWFLASRITAPLRQLTRAAQPASRGEAPPDIPVLGDYPEVEVLSQTLRQLVNRQEAQRRQLETLASTLDSRVQARTAELVRTNETLATEVEERRKAEAERERLFRRLEELSMTDPLTGVRNRRGFDQLAAREIQRSRRTGERIWLIMLDVDHFKRVNDTYGHAAGDEALRAVGACCREQLREIDVLARFGGEEFVILLAGTDQAEAIAVAERLRRAVAALTVPTAAGPLRLTASFGVAPLQPHAGEDDLEAAIALADAALYEAKRAGRDRVRLALSPEMPGTSVQATR